MAGPIYVQCFVDKGIFHSYFKRFFSTCFGVTNCAHPRVAALSCDPPKRCGAFAWLEQEFCAQLNKARRGCADNLAERGAIDISVDGLRSEKLRVVENVEAFQAKLQRLRFRQAQILEKRHIVIVHPGAVEKAPR